MDITREIRRDRLITKFSLYGFLKNLKFFEPFLVIYLLSFGFSLLEIGVLYSIREVTIYIFEVPSGIFADHYGKKTELSICFLFYIISFIFFFISGSYAVFVVAMIFFGAGEAFRSGTHKAIIMEYLEEKGWFGYKSMVYGRTRSFSLIGSSISSFVSIIFLLSFDNMRLLFLICIIPYLMDFVLILTYPQRFNSCSVRARSFRELALAGIRDLKKIFKDHGMVKAVVSSSVFDAAIKGTKDYIQPVLQAIILTSSFSLIKGFNADDTLAVYLAVVYGLLYIISSFATKNVYRLKRFGNSPALMNSAMDILGIAFLLLALFIQIEALYVLIIIYFAVIILKDTRRPVFVDVIGDLMDRNQRATVLSVDSQLRSLFMIIFAPLFGFLADSVSIPAMFVFIGVICIAVNRFARVS